MGTEMVRYQENAVIGTRSALKELILSDQFKSGVSAVTPKHLDPDRLIRMVLSAESRNPRILQCTMGSILKSAIESSTLGLDCSGLLGRGYLVPYKNGRLSQQSRTGDVYEAQFQPGYLGLVDLARRSGEVLDVRAIPVYEGDDFDYGEGLKPFIHHKPLRGDPRKAPAKADLLYCYAVADFKNGFQKQQVMTIGQIETYRKRSRAANDGPWVTDYEAMCLKTVVKRLCKWLPQSPELARALASEEAVEMSVGVGETEAIPVDRQIGHQSAAILRGDTPPPPQMEPRTEDDTPKRRGRRTNAEIEAARQAEEAAKVREANTPPQVDPGANTGPASGKPETPAANPWVPFQIDDVVQGTEDKGDTLWVLLGRTGKAEVTSPEAFNLAGDSKGRACRIVGRKHKATARVLVESVTDLADLDEGGSNAEENDSGEIPFN